MGSQPSPFFSIIIPAYNRANLIGSTIQSVLGQRFKDFELIIVDDGSVDNTEDVVRKIKDSRIQYYKKRNEERSIARNFGINKASGRYINFLDSDDKFFDNHLETGYNLLVKNKFPEIGHLGYKLIDDCGNTILTRNTFDNSFKGELIRENILHGNAIFIRSDVVTEVHFIPSPSAILAEDWYLWLRLAARYNFHFDNTVTSVVVQHSARSLMNIDADKLIANTEIIVEYLKKDERFLQEFRNEAAYHFANHYTFLTLILALTKKRRLDTMRYLIKAIRYDPMVVARRRFLASLKHLL